MPHVFIVLAIHALIHMMRRPKTKTQMKANAPARVGWLLYVRWGLLVALTSGIIRYVTEHQGEPLGLLYACSVWVVPILLLVIYPELLLRVVIVPLGIPKMSMWAALILRPSSMAGEEDAGPLFLELLARVRSGRGLDADSRAALRKDYLHLPFIEAGWRGVTLSVLAIEHAIEGRRPKARTIFRLVAELPDGHASRSIRAYAQSFLIADAAERGAWQAVLQVSREGPRTWRARFFSGVASRFLDIERQRSPRRLQLAWFLAPGRAAHYPLLLRALRAPERKLLLSPPENFEDALRRLRTFSTLADGFVRRKELLVLGAYFDGAFSRGGEVEKRIVRRCEVLGEHVEPDSIVVSLEDEVRELFGRAWETALWAETDTEKLPDFVFSVLNARISERLADLEALCGALVCGQAAVKQRVTDYWEAWLAVRELLFEFFFLYPERRADLANAAGDKVLNHGVWLHNQGEFYGLAYDVFRVARETYGGRLEGVELAKNNATIAARASGARLFTPGLIAKFISVTVVGWFLGRAGTTINPEPQRPTAVPDAQGTSSSQRSRPDPVKEQSVETPTSTEAGGTQGRVVPGGTGFVTIKAPFGEFSSVFDEDLDRDLTNHYGPPVSLDNTERRRAAVAPIEMDIGKSGSLGGVRLLFEGLEKRGYVEGILSARGTHLVWASEQFVSPDLPHDREQTLLVDFDGSRIQVELLDADGQTVLGGRSLANATPVELAKERVPDTWANLGRKKPLLITFDDSVDTRLLFSLLEWFEQSGNSEPPWALISRRSASLDP